MQTSNDKNLKLFQKAFKYFFHVDCRDGNAACKAIANQICANPSIFYAMTKRAQTLKIKKNLSTIEICQQFDEIIKNEASYAEIRLNILFENLLIQNLFAAYDDIIRFKEDCFFRYNLSDQFDCSCYASGTRLINIVLSKDEDLGLKLDIDGKTATAFVEKIIDGGAVYKSGCIKTGDYVLKINDIDTKYKTVDELNNLILKTKSGDVVKFLVESNLKNEFSYYARSLINFVDNTTDDNNNENILSLAKGDIIEVFGEIDNVWLKARLIGNNMLKNCNYLDNNKSMEFGVIPLNPTDQEPHNYVVEKCKTKFEKLLLINPCKNIIRCLLLVGPSNIGRDELKKKLICTFPNKFANVVPYTTRKPKNNEINGVDYNFVERIEMEQLILSGRCVEYGEYKGNLYGTTYQSIITIMEEHKVPVLNVSLKTIMKLRNITFKPLIIFIKPPDIITLKETRLNSPSTALTNVRKCPDHFSDMDFKEMISNASIIHKTFGAIFDATITSGDFEETFYTFCKVLHAFETQPHFILQNWVDWI